LENHSATVEAFDKVVTRQKLEGFGMLLITKAYHIISNNGSHFIVL